MQDNNENEKVSIKLERYKWPDEIRKERKKKQRNLVIIIGIIGAFALGFLTSNLTSKPVSSESTNLSAFENVYNTLLQDWYFGNDMKNPAEEIMKNAITGMLDLNGDIHTSYLTREQVIELNESINMNFVGIGVGYQVLGENFIVTKVYKDSPAEKAGVEAGDIITKVEGVSVEGKTTDEIKDEITGDEGTNVLIEFRRGNDLIEFNITRGSINAIAWGEILEGNIGYIEISSFGNNLGSVVESYLQQFKEANVKGLIIDLRDNGGGYLSAIEEIGDLFFDNGQVLYQEEFKSGETEVYKIKNSVASKYKFEKTVVMINENSASASEVLGLAFQENTDAIILGNTSYGKGTVQTTRNFVDGSALKVTIARWLSPEGNSIHGTGITPDEKVLLADIFYEEYVQLKENEVYPYDSVHPSVAYVQKGLKYLGIHDGRVDGYFDQATLDSLKAFNQKFGYNKEDIDTDTMTNVYQEVLVDWNTNRKDKDVQLQQAIKDIE